MASSCLVNIVTLLLLVLANAVSGGSFSPHEYGCSRFNHYLGPQQDWEADLAPAFNNGSFTVVIHGVAGSGKSALTKMLCGEHDSLVIGRQAVDDTSGIRSVSRESKIFESRSRIDPHSATIYVIDSPGFLEPNRVGQLQALQGVDRAHELARQSGVPLRRIYFLLDWTDSIEPIPHNLKSHLRVLLYRYGASAALLIRFVISKSDRLRCLNISNLHIRQFMSILSQCYQDVFNHHLPVNGVIFVAAHPDNLQCRTIRQLTTDLVRASEELLIFPRHDGYLDENVPHLTPLRELQAQATQIQQHFKLNSVSIPSVGDRYRNLLDLRRVGEDIDQSARSLLSLLQAFIFEQKQKVLEQEMTGHVFKGATLVLSKVPVPPVQWVGAASAIISGGCSAGADMNAKILKKAEHHANQLEDCLKGLERDLASMCGCSSYD